MSKCEICLGEFNRGEVICHCNSCWNKNLAQQRKEGRKQGAIEGNEKLRRIKECLDYYDTGNYYDAIDNFETPEEALIRDLKKIIYKKRLKELEGSEINE